MSSVSKSEIERWALDASDWLWGTVQGAFNEQQTTSQILVDAIVGMVPLVGDVTAARDLIAVSTRLAEDPRKREEVWEWVLLVVLVFALIPLVGGVIKGVGRLLMKAAKEGAEHSQALRDLVEFLNRVGHGNALKWLKELDFTAYRPQVSAKFAALMDKFLEVFEAFQTKLGWPTESMKSAIERWISGFRALKAKGGEMIPQALAELNKQLKAVQQAVYSGEWHVITPGTKTVTREAEARLLENAPRKLPRTRKGFPANTVENYKHVEGWPDLRKTIKYDAKRKRYHSDVIAAFSGSMRPVDIKSGQSILRILHPAKNYKAGAWWVLRMPESPEAWRELLAVLDEFNVDGFFVKYIVPDGVVLKGWAGKAAEQYSETTGQYLPGGGEQLYIEFNDTVKAQLMKLPAMSTGWGRTLRLVGFGADADAAVAEIRLEKLAENEAASK